MIETKIKEKILKQLSQIIDPDLNQDIVSLGFIKNLKLEGGCVSLTLELTTPACPIKEEFKQKAEELLLELAEISKVDIKFSAQVHSSKTQIRGLQKVRNIISISSCKGGVGKSTFTANIASMLKFSGAKVGIFDADIHGPSQHILFDVHFNGLYQSEGLIIPQECTDIKLMSFEYLKNLNDSTVMRGPMASKVVVDLITNTDWGKLDYLIIDTPPGTSDIHLSLGQNLEITANIIITTPQQLSFIDVIKGIKMFNQLAIPTIACIQNMAYYEINGKKDYLFGRGMNKELEKLFGIKANFDIPLNPALSHVNGLPYIEKYPESSLVKLFSNISSFIIREIERLKFNTKKNYTFNIDDNSYITLSEDDNTITLSAYELRKQCRCALCINEFTGEVSSLLENINTNVLIQDSKKVGRYALQIIWDDGHQSIYPYDKIFQKN